MDRSFWLGTCFSISYVVYRMSHRNKERDTKYEIRATNLEGGCSSAGRAPPSHGGGQRFDPAHLHHFLVYRMSYVVCRKEAKDEIRNTIYEQRKKCRGRPGVCPQYVRYRGVLSTPKIVSSE